MTNVARRTADLPPADDRTVMLGDLGEVSAAVAAARNPNDPGPAQLNCAFRENLCGNQTA